MVVEAGSPGLQKQIVKPESLKSMEERYEETLQELAAVVKVTAGLCVLLSSNVKRFKKCVKKLFFFFTEREDQMTSYNSKYFF